MYFREILTGIQMLKFVITIYLNNKLIFCDNVDYHPEESVFFYEIFKKNYIDEFSFTFISIEAIISYIYFNKEKTLSLNFQKH